MVAEHVEKSLEKEVTESECHASRHSEEIVTNKVDCDIAGYKQERYEEISNNMMSKLINVV